MKWCFNVEFKASQVLLVEASSCEEAEKKIVDTFGDTLLSCEEDRDGTIATQEGW